ncbi:putative reverse transcriptase domain-containing protein [Tanacetum coccineum]
MIRRGFVFEERPNEAIDVPIKDEKSPLSKSRGSPHDSIIPPKSAPMTQAVIRRMIKESVDASIATEWARKANVRNDASGSGPVRGQDTTPVVRECTFDGFMKCNLVGKKVNFDATTLEGPALTWWKTKVATKGLETVNQMPWTEMKQLMTAEFCPIKEVQRMEHELMVETERVKVDAYIRGLTNNIKGEVTSSKPADLNEAVRIAHKLMEQKSQARDARILEGKKQKWERFQSGNSSGKGNQKDNSRQTLQNSQKQRNARAMVTAPTDGKLPLCERCFTRHVGQCTIKCHKCGKKIKQEEAGEVHGQAYAIKDAEPQGPNVVTGTFLLNNRYASVLFNSGFDRSFVDTRFSSMLDIDQVKIGASYEVELADGRVVSTNTILKGCTLNLVKHVFEIDLMPIELGTFDIIIGMDWLVKHDTVIVCGEKVVRIPYGNKMLIVKSDKGVSRLKCMTTTAESKRRLLNSSSTGAAHVAREPSDRHVLDERVCDTTARAAGERIYLSEFITVGSTGAGKHLKIILELLKKERLYAKFSKCDLWLDSVQFLGHVIDRSGVHVDPAKIEAIKSWAAPTTTEVRQFLRLAGYYRRFIEGFSLISKPLTKLTQKNKKYEWGKEEDGGCQMLNRSG